MSETKARQPKGISVGGQFAAASHAESGLALSGPAVAQHEGLDRYGPIPAPLESQTLADGSPAAATFEESFREYFRPLAEHEAAHGPYEATRPVPEDELLDLAGLRGVNLGREEGVCLAKDEYSGGPVIIVSTRNGGYYADCYEDDCDGTCPGCIQTDVIPGLPTYLRSEHEGGDSENYFSATDPAAGLAALRAQEQQEKLHRLNYDRNAIASGKQPPWIVLSPIREESVRDGLRHELQKQREQASYRARDRRHADGVLEAISAGVKLPSAGMIRVPDAYFRYNTCLDYLSTEEAAAASARASAATLGAELSTPLPPAITALATAEHARLGNEAARLEAKAQETKDKLKASEQTMKSWAALQHRDADEADAKVASADAQLKDFDWSESFPGDLADCPPRPALVVADA